METQTAITAQINPALVIATGQTFFLRPNDIRVSAEFNPRRFAPSAKRIQEMADSLLEEGQIQPIGLRPSNDPTDPRPMLAFGFTRHTAAVKLSTDGIGGDANGEFLLECKWDDSATDEGAFIRAGRENNDRNDMSRIDRAYFVDRLIAEFGYSQSQCAKLLKLSPATITQDRKLLKLSPRAQRMVHDGKLAADAALELCDKTHEEQDTILELLKGKKRGSKSDTQDAAAEQANAAEDATGDAGKQSGPTALKLKPKTAKVLMKNVRETYSQEAMEAEGWQASDLTEIVAYFETLCAYLSGTSLKGRRNPPDWKMVAKAFNKMLGV